MITCIVWVSTLYYLSKNKGEAEDVGCILFATLFADIAIVSMITQLLIKLYA